MARIYLNKTKQKTNTNKNIENPLYCTSISSHLKCLSVKCDKYKRNQENETNYRTMKRIYVNKELCTLLRKKNSCKFILEINIYDIKVS